MITTIDDRNLDLAKELLPEVEELIDTFLMEHLDGELDMDDLVDQHDFVRKYIIKQLAKGIK
jgi:hypothetical protein